MPPKPSNHAQFPVSDPDNEVVCPISQADGTGCRKRCLGEKRFRSMQEHIRRAHPEYYIPKLPATKESFELMINTPPHEIPKPEAQDHWSPPSERRERHYIQRNGQADGPGLSYAQTHDSFDLQRSFDQAARQNDTFYGQNIANFDLSRSPAHLRRGSLLPAAAALAQLHYARPEGDWSNDHVGMFQMEQDDGSKGPQNFFTDDSADVKQNNFADPTLSAEQQFLDTQYRTDNHHNNGNGNGNGHLVEPSSSYEHSPPNRSAAPAVQMQRSWSKGNRPRKSSVSQSARRPKHERRSSRDYLRPVSHDRKAMSQDPMNAASAAMMGKRWEDLIDAATSATEEDRDLTPIPASPFQSPRNSERTPMPAPFALGSQFQSYTASPLQQALTPPPADGPQLDLQPFPSVEEPSSIDSSASGANFHIMASNQALSSASDSSPMFTTPVQIYCAGCRRLSVLKESYACPECICGLCQGCVDALISEQNRGRPPQCPRCRTIGGRFKLFQLDIR